LIDRLDTIVYKYDYEQLDQHIEIWPFSPGDSNDFSHCDGSPGLSFVQNIRNFFKQNQIIYSKENYYARTRL